MITKRQSEKGSDQEIISNQEIISTKKENKREINKTTKYN